MSKYDEPKRGKYARSNARWRNFGGSVVSTLALSLAFTTATISSTGAPDADGGTTALTWTNPANHRMQYNKYGVLQYAPHNLYLNSAAPANQSVTVVSGISYTLTVTGTVSITLSGAGSGTATAGSDVVFTASTTTATCGTTSGSGTAQLRLTNAPDTYVETSGAAVYGARAGTDNRKPVTNLALYPENLDKWGSTRASWSGGQTDAFGDSYGYKLVEDSSDNTHYAETENDITFVSGKPYTLAGYGLPDERGWITLELPAARFPANSHAYFNVTTGAKGTIGSGVEAGISEPTSSGKYRCWITSTCDSSGTGKGRVYLADADNSNSYQGDGSSGAILSAFMLNEGGIEPYVGSHNIILDDDADGDKAFSGWSATNVTIDSDSTVAPDGTTTADTLGDDSSTGTGQVYILKNITFDEAGTYKFRIKAKPKQLSWITMFQVGYDEGSVGTYFDLTNASLGGTDNSNGAIHLDKNGFCDCSILITTSSDLTGQVQIYVANGDNDATVDLDGTSDIHIWGADLVKVKTATEYAADAGAEATNGSQDTAAGWVAGGTNTVEDDDGAVKITYVDGALGALIDDSDIFDTALTADAWYLLSFDAKTTGGVGFRTNGAGQDLVLNFNTSEFTTYRGFFKADSNFDFRGLSFGSGDVMWIKNISVKPITLSTGAYDQPFSGAPMTGYVKAGYTSEPTATNLETDSNDFSAWTIDSTDSVTITAAQGVGPDGLNSLSKIEITDATSEPHSVYNTKTTSVDTDYCHSAYIRGGATRYILMQVYYAPNDWVNVMFDTYAGVVTDTAEGSGTSSLTDYGMIPLKDGAYRIWLVNQESSNTTAYTVIALSNAPSPTYNASNGSYAYVGAAGDEIYAGFVDVVAGTFPQSHIATDGGTATRTADPEDLDTSISWFNAAAGTIISEATPNGDPTSNDIISLDDDTANEVIKLSVDASDNIDFNVIDGGVSQDSIDSGVNAVNGVAFKVAASFLVNDDAVSANGNTAVTGDGTSTLPTVTQLQLKNGFDHKAFKFHNTNRPDATIATDSTQTAAGITWKTERAA